MTPERAKELLPIITAFANGETIEMQTARENWVSFSNYEWSDRCKYRIKPKPPEYRLYRYTDGNRIVGIVTRNTKEPHGKYHLDGVNENVKNGQIVWLSDWMPIPNYED